MVYKVGDIVECTVTGIQPYGAFVSIDTELSGLIHISEISEKFVRNIQDIVRVGEKIKVRILEIDSESKHAKLSIKVLKNNYHRVERRNTRRQNRGNEVDFSNLERYFPLLSDKLEKWMDQYIKKIGGNTVLTFDYSNVLMNVDFSNYQEKIQIIHQGIESRTNLGSDFMGWVDWPIQYDREEFNRILDVSSEIINECEVFVVCGIGGSYLGAKAAIDFLHGSFLREGIEIIFLGNTFSSTYTQQVLDYIKNKEFAVNVISKSGTTTETAIAFRLLKKLAEDKYGKSKASKRIIATTDQTRGVLKQIADQEGYRQFVIPNDIGGRYSVLTAVGLLPIAVSGANIEEIMLGASQAHFDFSEETIEKNNCYQYAVVRDILYHSSKSCEMFVCYEPQFTMLGEWWKQLFGESEGKQGKGLFPASVTFSTDLHSMGQYIQDGNKILFETILRVEHPLKDLEIPMDKENFDGLNYLSGKNLSEINHKAMEGTLKAHVEAGKVPNIVINLSEASAYSFGYLCYFYMKACAISAYLLEVNPFNQPGVEVYKKNMFQLLGKE